MEGWETMRYLLLAAVAAIASIFAGCVWSTERSTDDRLPDYDRAFELIIESWTNRFGAPTSTCVGISVSEVSADTIGVDPNKYGGFYSPDNDEITIIKSMTKWQKKCAAAHECLHRLSFIERGDVQSTHADPDLWWQSGGENSIEYIVCASLY
jgi:hypothetical protein